MRAHEIPSLPVSVVIASHNEGDSLGRTVDNVAATLPNAGEIIVVDDRSSDSSSEGLPRSKQIRVFRPDRRLGASAARNFGAQQAKGRILAFSDAHVEAPDGWFPAFRAALLQPEVGAVGPAYREMKWPEVKGYGLKLTDAGLNWTWMGKRTSSPYQVPMLGGYFLAMRTEVFWWIGGFDEGFGVWGMEDLELALRIWLLGYDCILQPNVEVAHLSREAETMPRYQANWQRGLRNTLRVAVLHLCRSRIQRVFQHYAKDPMFPAALADLAVGDVWQKRAELLAIRSRTDDWFFNRFGILF